VAVHQAPDNSLACDEGERQHRSFEPLQAVLADRVFDGERMLKDCAVIIDGARIANIVPQNAIPEESTIVDLGTGSVLAPGFIDVQVNGGGGVLLNDEPTLGGIRTIAAAHRRFGTTGLLPTLITDVRENVWQLSSRRR